MKLEELKLVSFKGFSEFRVPLTQFTCLVGPNNGGKTSILHAVQLLFDILRFAFGNRTQPDFANIQWQSNPTQVLQRLTFGDPDAIWLRKRTSEQCRIEATLSEGVSIALLIKGPNSYVLDITREGKSINTSPLGPEHRPIIEAIWKLQPAYVPPVGAVAPAEGFLNHHQLEQNSTRDGLRPVGLTAILALERWRQGCVWPHRIARKTLPAECLSTAAASESRPPTRSSDRIRGRWNHV